MSFKPGDVVQVRSGGPPMTVEKIDGDQVTCSWMERSGTQKAPKYTPKSHEFAAVLLIPFKRQAIGVRF